MTTVDELLAQAAASKGAAAGGSDFANAFQDADLMQVYLGSTPPPGANIALHADVTPDSRRRPKTGELMGDYAPWQEFGPGTTPGADRTSPANTAANAIFGWSAKERNKWAQTLVDAGLIEEGNYNFADLVQWWNASVQGAAQLYTLGNKKVTPQQFAKNFLGMNGVNGGGSKPKTNTQTNYSHISDADAEGVALDTYSQMLGRAPDAHEAAGLKAALKAYVEAHPSVTTSETTTKGGDTSTTSHTKGGVSTDDLGNLARESVQQKPEYASYQAAATYFPVLEQLMGGAGLEREF